jgi:hypothetical protein
MQTQTPSPGDNSHSAGCAMVSPKQYFLCKRDIVKDDDDDSSTRKPPHLRAKQHNNPDLARNQQQPQNLTRATTAFAHSNAWKNLAVRLLAPLVKPNLSTLSLVMATASNALLKIQNTTNLVRKLLYESSSDFASLSLGAT